MKLIILIILNLICLCALARSGGAGNGGDAIVCPDKVILLDSYEAQKMRLEINLTNPGIKTQSWRSMVNVAVKRLQVVDEMTATLLYDYAMEMVNDFEKFQLYPNARGKYVYIGEDIIGEINDSEHVSMPVGCEEHPRQLVSQRVPRFKREYRYEFSKILWDRMSLQEQSMTILHEAWYRIMLENGAKTSRAARYINGLLASTDFEQLSFSEYIEEIKNTELKYYTVPNKSLGLRQSEIKFNLQDHILNFADDEMVCAPNFKLNPSIKETYTLLNREQNYLENVKFQNVCFKNSRLRKLVMPLRVPNNKTTLRLIFHQVEFEKALDKNPSIIFDNQGKLSSIEGVKFDSIMEMFYRCNGKKSYTKHIGCESGPFIDHSTKIINPSEVKFGEDEKLLQYL